MSVAEFYDFMIARESARQKRLTIESGPWSIDPVIQDLRLPNVKREHDETTRIFIDEFYKPNWAADLPVILYNAAMVRFFGTVQWMRIAGWQNTLDPFTLLAKATNALIHNTSIYTNAYAIGGSRKNEKKFETYILGYLQLFWDDALYISQVAYKTQSWQKVAECLHNINGFGPKNFMIREVLLDSFYCNFWEEGKPQDYHTWFPVTKGAIGGMKELEHPVKMSGSAFDCLVDIYLQHKIYWPKDYPALELEDIDRQLAIYAQCKKGGKKMRKYTYE